MYPSTGPDRSDGSRFELPRKPTPSNETPGLEQQQLGSSEWPPSLQAVATRFQAFSLSEGAIAHLRSWASEVSCGWWQIEKSAASMLREYRKAAPGAAAGFSPDLAIEELVSKGLVLNLQNESGQAYVRLSWKAAALLGPLVDQALAGQEVTVDPVPLNRSMFDYESPLSLTNIPISCVRWFLHFMELPPPALSVAFESELVARESSIHECYLAYHDSGSENPRALLHYLDYQRHRAVGDTQRAAIVDPDIETMSVETLTAELQELTHKLTPGTEERYKENAPRWWQAYQKQCGAKEALTVARELQRREANLGEFFYSYIYSVSNNAEAVLHFMEFIRILEADDQQRRMRPGVD